MKLWKQYELQIKRLFEEKYPAYNVRFDIKKKGDIVRLKGRLTFCRKVGYR